MLHREIIAVCSQIHTKHINTLCGQNVELLNVKSGAIYCDHRAWIKFKQVYAVQPYLFRYLLSIIPSYTCLSNFLFHSGLRAKIFHAFFVCTIRATHPAFEQDI